MMLRSIDPQALLLLLQQVDRQEEGEGVAISDEMALDEALAYPLMQAMRHRADVADIAVAHAIGVLRHRPFSARNEQAALLALGLFLYLNSWPLHAQQGETARLIWQASAADIDEGTMADWVRQRL